MPAGGTELKTRLHFPAATGTRPRGHRLERTGLRCPLFIKDSATAITFQEALSPLDWKKRNEKEAQVMVQALEPG